MPMKKSYSTYKETDIPWIGKVPAHWKMQKMRTLLQAKSIKNREGEQLLSVVREEGVIVRNVESKEENHNFIPDDLTNYKFIEVGDFVVNKMKSWQGSYAVTQYKGIVSPAYYTFDLHFPNKEFFNVAMRSNAYIPFFTKYSKGIRVGQWDLSIFGLKEIPLFIPPAEEQEAIVEYLERKVGEIDHFVELTEQRIERLRELKQAVISEAVTRGIDPSAPLTPSGIPWLGDVPAHWQKLKLSQVASVHFISNRNVLHQNLLSLSYGKIVQKDIDSNFGLLPSSFDNYQVIEPGNIILRLTDLQNDQKSLRVGLCNEVGIITSAYLALQNKKYVLSSFLYIALHVADIKKVFYGLGNGLRQSLNWAGLRNITLPIPPVEEQEAIVSYIEERVGRIDKLVASYEEQLERVRELKQSIISEAVTGQVCLV